MHLKNAGNGSGLWTAKMSYLDPYHSFQILLLLPPATAAKMAFEAAKINIFHVKEEKWKILKAVS